MNVLVFGDSIGLGLWDENGGWVGRLTEFLVKKSIASDLDEDYEIYNLGVSGDTTEGLVERFEFETRYRVGESETAIIFSAARAIFPVWLAEFWGTGYPKGGRCGGNRRRCLQALEAKTFRRLGE